MYMSLPLQKKFSKHDAVKTLINKMSQENLLNCVIGNQTYYGINKICFTQILNCINHYFQFFFK